MMVLEGPQSYQNASRCVQVKKLMMVQRYKGSSQKTKYMFLSIAILAVESLLLLKHRDNE
jgi:hypothetical protein